MDPIPITDQAIQQALTTAVIPLYRKQQVIERLKEVRPDSLLSYSTNHITIHTRNYNGSLFRHTWNNEPSKKP